MNSLNVDEILNRLSTKFNKIFYDREFVYCVNQDFEVVLKNKHSCCVVVFPVLGPNYLKAVRYQAKILDLAVITLGTNRNRAIAVCRKEFLKKNSNEVIETRDIQIMPQSSTENTSTKLRKKRPERQLYVPPAQRRLNTDEVLHIIEKNQNAGNEEVINTKKETCFKTKNPHKDSEKNIKLRNKQNDLVIKNKRAFNKNLPEFVNSEKYKVIENEERVCFDYLSSLNFIYTIWQYQVSENNSSLCLGFCNIVNLNVLKVLPIYRRRSHPNVLYVLHKNLVLWQPKLYICCICDNTCSGTSRTYPIYDFEEVTLMPNECDFQKKKSVFSDYKNESNGIYKYISRNFDYLEYTAFKIFWAKNECVSETDVIIDLSVIDCGHIFFINSENGKQYYCECEEDHKIMECYLDKKEEMCNRKYRSCKDDTSLLLQQQQMPLIKSSVVILDDRTSLNKTEDNSILTVKKNNDKNTANINDTRRNLIQNVTNEMFKPPKKSNEHEQEKEIMRKTKEHINRKSRPIIKYVDDIADTLKIGKNDDVNNWEELFDDNGHLQEEIFKEVVDKVGTEVTIVKAKEDYSDYVTKQSEDLEHMVELYDFPPTFETPDIIQAFSVIDSEAMYVKWVDDTHAILVLGSFKQAQRAIQLDNPLIKARPMTAASSTALATAYKYDLKPAMKRPQTNLQTARRLITTYLGTKSRISKEQSAKEKNDLKAAKELKKLTKKNEQDAWEGNLRSAIH